MSAAMRWEELVSYIREIYFKEGEHITFDTCHTVIALSNVLRKAKALEDRDYSKSLTKAGY